MATVTLNFSKGVNKSVQIGDIVYYVPIVAAGTDAGNVSTATGYSNIVKMGAVVHIKATSIIVDHDDNVPAPTTSNFIMFSKDNSANLSSLLGYYADIKFVNKSTDKAEIFSVGCDVFESSK